MRQSNRKFGLSELLYPITPDDFFKTYYGKQLLWVEQQRSSDYFTDLFNLSALDATLQFSHPAPPDIRVVKNQEELLPGRYTAEPGNLDLNQLYKAYNEGYSLVLNRMQRYDAALHHFAKALEESFNFGVRLNAYLTPSGATALAPHFDTHDVFVLQISGSKTWSLYDGGKKTPLLDTFQPVIAQQDLPAASREVTLEAGQMMYLPRGTIHSAHCTEDHSLHVTAGIYPLQWYDLLQKALMVYSETDESMRQAITPGFLSGGSEKEMPERFADCVKKFAENANFMQAMSMVVTEHVFQLTPAAGGQLTHVVDSADINSTTIFAKRPFSLVLVHDKLDGRVAIQFPGNTISGVAPLKNLFVFIAETPGNFSIAELPESQYNKSDLLVLMKRLVVGGLLEIVN